MTQIVFEEEYADMMAGFLNRTPAGRMGKPVDIAGPVLSLASDAASWITGQVIAVDGGYTIRG